MLSHLDSQDSQEHKSDSMSDIIQDTELENGILVESGENIEVVTRDKVNRELIVNNVETNGSENRLLWKWLLENEQKCGVKVTKPWKNYSDFLIAN